MTAGAGGGAVALRRGRGAGAVSRGASALAVAWLLAGGAARAEERPDEEALFGGSSSSPPAGSAGAGAATGTSTSTTTATTAAAPVPASPAPASGEDARDETILGDPNAAARFSSGVAPEDPLSVGGQLYWRVLAMAGQGQSPPDWALAAPALLDVYLDARPNERVRAFVLGRMFYDPTRPLSGASGSALATGTSAQSSDSTSANLLGQATRGPSTLLDQMWLRFDLLRRVFVTAGKQHVRWGTARFWAPTDYLHMQPRNPLLPFDARSGVTMLKLHVPWEARGWNLYAYVLPENVDATATLRKVAAAARAEVVVGTLEVGAGVFGRPDSKAKFAGDLSFGVWDLDVYGEVAVRSAADIDFVRYQGAPAECVPSSGASVLDELSRYYAIERGSRWKPQVTAGATYTRKYADKDTFTVGAEYFYNGLGYTSVKDYLGLFAFSPVMRNPATFFYLGRQYLGVFATAPAPYGWDLHTFTLSSLANLSDRSGITRFDYGYTLLTHLRFEAYAAVHWGQRNGEFRLAFDSADLPCPTTLPFARAPSLLDLGVGLRVAM